MTMHDRTHRDIEARLRAYADEQLQPDPTAMARVRDSVLLAARSSLPGAPAPVSAPAGPRPLTSRRRLSWLDGLAPRLRARAGRSGLALAGAGLAAVLVGGGAYAASQPGAPLYGARLWLESTTLPTSPDARLTSDVARLQARLDEAATAARAGDGPAVTAALAAYRETVADALRAAGTDLTREERLQIVLERHQLVLQTLVARLPDGGADAVRAVLQRTVNDTSAALDRIEAGEGAGGQGAGGRGAGAGQGNGTGTGSGAAGNGNEPPASPGQGNGPQASPGQGNGGGPQASPVAQHTPAPQPTPSDAGHGHSPQPHSPAP